MPTPGHADVPPSPAAEGGGPATEGHSGRATPPGHAAEQARDRKGVSRAVSDLEEAEQADPFSGAVQSGVGNLDPFGAAGQDVPSSSGKGVSRAVSDLDEAERLREQEKEKKQCQRF